MPGPSHTLPQPSLWRHFLQFLTDFSELAATELAAVFQSVYLRPVARFFLLLLILPMLFLWQTVNWLFFLLDELLYPAAREQPLVRPLFVLGPPRSGTTFLHRILAESSPDFCSASAWELFFAPSICQKKICRGLRALDRKFCNPLLRTLLFVEQHLPGNFAETHPGSLRDPEEDYFYLVPLMACTGWMIPFPAWRGFRKLLPGCAEISDAKRRCALHFYRRCLQKQLFVAGKNKILLSKNASFSSWADLLPEFFPDARWVVCMRSPLETVPSMLSTASHAMDGFCSRQNSPVLQNRLLAAMQAHYQVLHRSVPDYGEAVVVDNVELTGNLPEVLQLLQKKFELDYSERFTKRIPELSAASSRHQSPHKYSLEDFDLDREGLLSSCPVLSSSLKSSA